MAAQADDDRRQLRIAVQGCGHGVLDNIYTSVDKQCKYKGWDGVDLVIVGGDFQAARNRGDLSCIAMPEKYRTMADFHQYYSGAKKAPYLTIYVGGNHEAINYHTELMYGGWVAPNIYYLGDANIVQIGGLRIGGLSGIWKGYSYRKRRYERIPYLDGEERTIYHQRETDVRKFIQTREQIDIMLSHDWPREVEYGGDRKWLMQRKPHFEEESRNGTLGSVAGKILLDRLRPAWWFSAHMHIRFEATIEHPDPSEQPVELAGSQLGAAGSQPAAINSQPAAANTSNPDEISLDDEADEPNETMQTTAVDSLETVPDESTEPEAVNAAAAVDVQRVAEAPQAAEIDQAEEAPPPPEAVSSSGVSAQLRAQLPASFLRAPPTSSGPESQSSSAPSAMPTGRPIDRLPPGITNRQTRFLALDKCLPRRSYLNLLTIPSKLPASDQSDLRLQYDPEWLAITRALGEEFDSVPATTNPADIAVSPDRGIEAYSAAVKEAREWIDSRVGSANETERLSLEIPLNFVITAPVHVEADGPVEVKEYHNPQTQQYCDMIGIPNPTVSPAPTRTFRRNREDFETAEEEQARYRQARRQHNHGHSHRGDRGGRGGRGRGGRGRGAGYGGGRGRGQSQGGEGSWRRSD